MHGRSDRDEGWCEEQKQGNAKRAWLFSCRDNSVMMPRAVEDAEAMLGRVEARRVHGTLTTHPPQMHPNRLLLQAMDVKNIDTHDDTSTPGRGASFSQLPTRLGVL